MIDWPALLISSASLVISLLTFYRVEMRGPHITVTSPLENRQKYLADRGTWSGGFPTPQVIEVRLLIANDGPRAGLLESFNVDAVEFLPHQPRIMRAASSVLLQSRRGFVLPLVVRDGEIVPAMVDLEITTANTNPGHQEQLAHDLRELTRLRVGYSYTSWRRRWLGRLRAVRERRHVDIDLADLQAAARKVFAERPDYRRALDILDGRAE
jgi:hypothetical protein